MLQFYLSYMEKSLGRVDRCPGVFSEGSISWLSQATKHWPRAARPVLGCLAEINWGLVGFRPNEKGIRRGCGPSGSQLRGHRFSAFWLRSSVVSVLISLISDTSPIWGLHIKRIFALRSWDRGLLRSLHASTRHCSAAGNGAPPSALSKETWVHVYVKHVPKVGEGRSRWIPGNKS